MNISIIGVGKLGLCFSLNLEKAGFNVVGMDVNKSYIESLSRKTFNSDEPGVNELLKEAKSIRFTTELKDALENDILFIVVNTPSTPDWKYDHFIIDRISDELIGLGRAAKRKDLIINSTTFPKYCESLQGKLKDYNYFVSYNPEFIAQGTILRDQVYAETVLIGEADEYAGDTIEQIYKIMCLSQIKFNRMGLTEAELVKLSVNCFLTTKISFANMIGDIAVRLNCNEEKVLSAIGADPRIGSKYLKYGFGFGGPCFPRDNRALAKCAEDVGVDAAISKATDEINKKHFEYQIQQFVKKNPYKEDLVEIEHITYKKESTLTEESQQLKFALGLKDLGYNIKILDDRESMKLITKQYGF